jgi:oxazoline/thiazoline dehydrogenase
MSFEGDSMTQSLIFTFRKEVSLIEASQEQATLEFPWGKITINELTPGLLAALRTLSSGGATENAISDLVMETDGAFSLAQLYYHLHRYNNLALLSYTLVADNQPVVTVVPMVPGFQFSPKRISVDTHFRLSRFAYCHREGDALVLESPLSSVQAIMAGHVGVALIAELAKPRSYQDLCASVDGLTEDTAQAFLNLLVNADMIAEVGEAGRLLEDENSTLAQWQFHDLLFHSRSRSGRHDYPIGGYFPFLGKIPPLPVLKPKMSDDVIKLYKPDINRLEQKDLPFTHVLENRKSIRNYGDQPIDAQQLGEFLYRVARVRRVMEADPARSAHYETSSRPYPSGGATYDLELYVTVDSCAGISTGIYHYDPLNHQLCKLVDRSAHVEAFLRDAQHSAALSHVPQILIILASRFQRLSWKYSGIAYATTLKNVGVLYQTMYLVAAAMGLAPCGLGAGNSSLFAEAVGTDYFAESSVGEFILGSDQPS